MFGLFVLLIRMAKTKASALRLVIGDNDNQALFVVSDRILLIWVSKSSVW
jgi:hypothetical protein